MTLVLATAIRGAVILGGDSRTSTNDKTGQFRISTDYTSKIFKLGDFGVGTAGWNIVDSRTIASHLEDIAATFTGNDLDSATEAIARHFESAFVSHIANAPASTPAVGISLLQFLLAGCTNGVAHIKRINFIQVTPNATTAFIDDAVRPGEFGTPWIGTIDVVCRLFNGLYVVPGVEPTQVALIRDSVPDVAIGHFSLQDGVNFVMFGIEATMKFQRFTLGHDNAAQNTNVGGAIDVATITAYGFEWKKKKDLEVRSQFSADFD